MFEKVNPSHPDKVADRIAGAVVDLAYRKADNPKIAVEVLLGHGRCIIIIESSETFADDEVQAIVGRIAGPMRLHLYSVKQDPILAGNQEGAVRCGDNGIFRGCHPTGEQALLTDIAGFIYAGYPSDGKYVIAGDRVTVCQSRMRRTDEAVFRASMEEGFGISDILINPLGEWTGGPDTDCGATNRKLGSDMGDGVTGGGLHGKDLSKADVSVNIWAYLESLRTGRPVEAHCSIGDEYVNGIPYADIVEEARRYIMDIGGFEKFAEWGLIRPQDV